MSITMQSDPDRTTEVAGTTPSQREVPAVALEQPERRASVQEIIDAARRKQGWRYRWGWAVRSWFSRLLGRLWR
jgi:hypothetical protein